VAAPTAGLHFTRELIEEIKGKGAAIATVTLHVGVGTFQPVRTDKVEEHHMHGERYSIPEETLSSIEGRSVLAVGTTSLRALETWKITGKSSGESELFIYPGFRFQVVDRLLTNFHLPKSTLLMLACAFGGKDNVLRAYEHAVRERYRFFSYGDAMLMERG
jgi:S-adenosylmethionine:tRNA ribosyltransferase-isomerase